MRKITSICIFIIFSLVFIGCNLSDRNNIQIDFEEEEAVQNREENMHDFIKNKEEALTHGKKILEIHFPEIFYENNVKLDAVEESGIWTVFNVFEDYGVTDEGVKWTVEDGGIWVEFRKDDGEVIAVGFDG